MQFGALLAAPLPGTALTLGTLRALRGRACRALVGHTERGALPDMPIGYPNDADGLTGPARASGRLPGLRRCTGQA